MASRIQTLDWLNSELAAARQELKDAKKELTKTKQQLAESRERLIKEEFSHLQTVEERDHHEESINQIADTLGLECEWSNLCDVGHECVEAVSNLVKDLSESQERERRLREALANSRLVVSEDKLGWFAIHPSAGSPNKPIAIFEQRKWASSHCEYGNEFNSEPPSQASAEGKE